VTLDLNQTEQPREFKFSGVFDQDRNQDEVFQHSALPLINHVINGFNGTFFVYGQTGTGKTHTMGVLNEISDESSGIIVNSLEHIFN
jgi:type II secretory ATPase GspE/PulE/Tfp pilus assembly ATPase PilB-like protein